MGMGTCDCVLCMGLMAWIFNRSVLAVEELPAE